MVIADYQVITDRDSVGADAGAGRLDARRLPGRRPRPGAHDDLRAQRDPRAQPADAAVPGAGHRRRAAPQPHGQGRAGRRPAGGPCPGCCSPTRCTRPRTSCSARRNLVPVGKDQLPHLEQARVIARRFDERFGRVDNADRRSSRRRTRCCPPARTSSAPTAHKMTKSRGNTIELGMTADETAKRIKRAVTDSDRHITYDPENRPEVSNLLLMAGLFADRDPAQLAEEIGDGGGDAAQGRRSPRPSTSTWRRSAPVAPSCVADPAHAARCPRRRQRPRPRGRRGHPGRGPHGHVDELRLTALRAGLAGHVRR